MENKYYTPELNEFFDKFEYEYFDIVWEKSIFDFRDLDVIDDEIREGKIRVKHLDREDIEEVLLPLGFIIKENKYNLSNHIDYLKGSIYEKAIGISLENSLVKIWVFDFKGENDSKSQQGPFVLKIKNKSELRKLMQQLNINSGGK